jgi:ferredoxin-NADP reductase
MAVVQKIRCRVEKITDHGDHVYSVDLKPERLVPRFRPGQFLHLALDEYDPSSFWPESRVFSIASSPLERDRISLAYSVRGRFTARMEKELGEGRNLWVKMPYGDFLVESTTPAVLLAGGTGITAFTAFLQGLSPGFPHKVYLGYGARTRELLILRHRLGEIQKKIPQLSLYFFVERLSPETREALPPDGYPEMAGPLSLDALWREIPDPWAATYYLSGPPAMIKNLGEKLREKRVQPGSVRIDAWE